MIDPPISHSVIVDATEQDHLIDSVTVFQAGRAEIKRRIQLQLKKGQNQITIEHLATCLEEDSLRVQGTGTAIIFDVVYHSPKPKPRYGRRQVDNYSSDEEEGEETERYDVVEALKKQRTVVENQISFLDRYGRSIDGQNSNVESLEHFLNVYGSRREALDKKIQELNIEVNRADKALRATQQRKSRRETKGQRRTKITITVMSKEEGKAELLLVYVVSDASWTPVYDIRASVSSSPNSPSTIELQYRASITQTTGEDWPEVALILSTATPYHGACMPTLSTWRIGLPMWGRGRSSRPSIEPGAPQTIYVPSSRTRSRSRSNSPTPIIHTRGARPREQIIEVGARRSRSRSSSRSPTRIIQVGERRPRSRSRSLSHSPRMITRESAIHVLRDSATPPPQIIRVREPTADSEDEPVVMITRQADGVDSGTLSATFNIQGRSNIPNDQGNHKVIIATLSFQVDPTWECIPRKDESVFLRCKVVNSSEFTFLPGEASVFIGDSFVSKSQIQHVPPNDSFQLSLGTDPTLRVSYAPIRTHKRASSQLRFTFPGRQKQPKQVTTKYFQHIVIRNTRATAVSALHIFDHVPVSNDSTIKVNVISPKELRENDRPMENDGAEKPQETWVCPQKGVRARWAPPDIGGEGAIEWVCSINAGGEMELKLEWEISAPEGTVWRNL